MEKVQCTSMVWPTLGSTTAKERNRTVTTGATTAEKWNRPLQLGWIPISPRLCSVIEKN